MYEKNEEIRKSFGYSNADVARGAGVPKSTLSEWKSGRSKPKTDKMGKIASFLGVSIETLEGVDNEDVYTAKEFEKLTNDLIEKLGLNVDEPKKSENPIVLAVSENIKRFEKELNIKPTEYAKRANIKIPDYISYKRGWADDIDEKTIAMLAEVAGVSSDEYKSTTIKKNTDKHNAELSANELKIVELFRLLNGEGQEKLIDYADDLVQSQKYIKSSQIEVGKVA